MTTAIPIGLGSNIKIKPFTDGFADHYPSPGGFIDVNREQAKRRDAAVNGKASPPVADHSPESARQKRSKAPLPNPLPEGARGPDKALSDDELLAARGTVELVPIEHLGASPYQPRIGYDDASIAELAASLRAAGRNHTDVIVRLVTAASTVATAARGMRLPKTKYEVLDGHRRLLAAKQAELPALWCKVIDLDDAAARRLCRSANLLREDLKPLERLYVLRDMLKDGDYATQADLAAAQGITPAALSNQLRILELPHEWFDLISQEKLTPTHLRSLATWADRPAVMAEMKRIVFDGRDAPSWDYDVGFGKHDLRLPTVKEFEEAVLDAVTMASRPIGKGTGYFLEIHYGANDDEETRIGVEDLPHPSAIKAQRDILDVVDVKGVGERAFNVAEWTKLSDQAKASRAKRSGRTAVSAVDGKHGSQSRGTKAKNLTAAEQRRRAEQKVKCYQRSLYTYRIEWLQKRIIERLASVTLEVLSTHVLAFAAAFQRPSNDWHSQHWIKEQFGDAAIAAGGRERVKLQSTDFWGTIETVSSPTEKFHREALTRWYAADLKPWRRPYDEAFVEGAAKQLGIDFAKEWKPDREFFELHTAEQLAGLWTEWRIQTEIPKKRTEIIDHFVKFHVDCPLTKSKTPKCLSKVKPCSIVR